MLEKVPRRPVTRGSARGRDSSWKRWSSSSDTGVLNLVWDPDLGVSVILTLSLFYILMSLLIQPKQMVLLGGGEALWI